MEHAKHKNRRRDDVSRRLGVAFCLLLAAGLLTAASASAGYEQVANFGSGELAEASALAVNTTSAGGVPAGTVYMVNSEARRRVTRYSPDGEFRAAWGWGVGDGSAEYQRCGPDGDLEPGGDPVFPICEDPKKIPFPSGEGLGQLRGPVGVAVEQSTGRVYVLDNSRMNGVVQVFNADGSAILPSFGERGVFGESIDAGPGKMHRSFEAGIAVGDGGVVYVSDATAGAPIFEERVMVFDDGVYTGRENDIARSGGLAIDSDGNLYVHRGNEEIYEFSPDQPLTPVCEFQNPAGGIGSMTVDPITGALFYYSFIGKREIQQLSPCNSEGKFEKVGTIPVTPKPMVGITFPLAFNPDLTWESGRPPGVLYAAEGWGEGVGRIFAPPVSKPPSIESQSVSGVGETSALLKAEVNPNGSNTSYAFQYLTKEAYEANEPDEVQSLSVSATGGVFGLGFNGRRYGGEASGALSAGSATVASLRTASGSATLKAASGTADLSAASGSGTVIEGSATITALTTSEGTFEVGQTISGNGIPPGAKILDASPTKLTISAPPSASAAEINLSAGSTTLTALTTSEGTFEVGQTISGAGIPSNAKILSVAPGELTISSPPDSPGTGVSIQSGSTTLTGLTTSEGAFEPGQGIEGTGIPPQTTILAVQGATLTISKPVTVAAVGAAIAATGPGPYAAGQPIEGPGIPPQTVILAAKAGELTLSAPASVSGSDITLHAGLPFDATALKVRSALASLDTIGPGNVTVSGGPGDETGSSPYLIAFSGALANADLPELEVEGAGLSGSSPGASVETQREGGDRGFTGAVEVPLGGALLGGGVSALPASVTASALTPGTEYRYRVVATNSEGVSAGAPESFRTSLAASPALPNGRAYELVTPVDKHGGEPFPLNPDFGSCGAECKPGKFAEPFPRQVSIDGDALVYSGYAFSFDEGASVYNEYFSKRTASGWQTKNLSPPLMGSNGMGYRAFNDDLSEGILYQTVPSLTPSAPSEYPNLYRQRTAEPGALSPLVTSPPLNRLPGAVQNGLSIAYARASADFSRHYFAANDALEGAVPPAVDGGVTKKNLYEFDGETLRLVNVLPDETTAPGAFFGSKAHAQGEASNLSHAISDNGSRVFWSDESGQVYVRKDGSSTEEIPDASKFLTASADGSRVLLTSGLLYDVENLASPPIDLSEGEGGFLGITGQSEDLSKIYFVDTAVLDEAPNAQGAIAQADEPNLYVWEEGGAARYVATLLFSDSPGVAATESTWAASPSGRLAQASPDGRWLTFRSLATLIDGFENGSFDQVYLYDSASDELLCPSCNPSGEASHGPSTVPLLRAGNVREDPQPQSPYLSDSGRLYFDSQDSLSARDTNGNVEDVYQYEPEGIGDCKREGGCVSLISGGREPNDSNFLAVDGSGKNVFFTSRDQLLLQDGDKLVDVYVAREGGGFPPTASSGGGECQGEACQSSPRVPAFPTPASGFTGAGNLKQGPTSKRCPKPKHKVRRKGKTRCVAPQRKRQRSSSKSKRAERRNRGGAR